MEKWGTAKKKTDEQRLVNVALFPGKLKDLVNLSRIISVKKEIPSFFKRDLVKHRIIFQGLRPKKGRPKNKKNHALTDYDDYHICMHPIPTTYAYASPILGILETRSHCLHFSIMLNISQTMKHAQ